jgi:hypothetical protein
VVYIISILFLCLNKNNLNNLDIVRAVASLFYYFKAINARGSGRPFDQIFKEIFK